MQQKMSRRN